MKDGYEQHCFSPSCCSIHSPTRVQERDEPNSGNGSTHKSRAWTGLSVFARISAWTTGSRHSLYATCSCACDQSDGKQSRHQQSLRRCELCCGSAYTQPLLSLLRWALLAAIATFFILLTLSLYTRLSRFRGETDGQLHTLMSPSNMSEPVSVPTSTIPPDGALHQFWLRQLTQRREADGSITKLAGPSFQVMKGSAEEDEVDDTTDQPLSSVVWPAASVDEWDWWNAPSGSINEPLSVPVRLDHGIAHPLRGDVRMHHNDKSRVLFMVPSLTEQAAGGPSFRATGAEAAYSWLNQLPATFISEAPLQFRIATARDVQPPWQLDYPNECALHSVAHPAWLLLHYIIREYDALPASLAYLSSYSRYERLAPHRDRLQLLARWRWQLLETEQDAYMPIHHDQYTCAETSSVGRHTSPRADALSHLWRAANLSAVPPARVCFHAGGEFMVHRMAVWGRTRQQYIDLLRTACAAGVEASHSLDALWHALFGQPGQMEEAPRRTVAADVLAWYDLPFYGDDRLGVEQWLRTTPPITRGETRLAKRLEAVPTPWEEMPLTVQIGDQESDSPTPRSVSINVTAALVVAAYKEVPRFLNNIDANIPRLLYRMKQPAEIASLDGNRTAEESSVLSSNTFHVNYTYKDSQLKGGRLHESRGHCSEASSYLLYILQYYDRLPEYSIFLHAHRSSWHCKDITRVVNHLNWTFVVDSHNRSSQSAQPSPFYFNVNTQMPFALTDSTWSISAAHWQDIFQGQLQPYVEQPPFPFVYHCCAQFMVHRDAILARPRSYWEHLYGWCRTTTVKPYFSGRVLEWMWAPLFGQPSVGRLKNLYPCGTLSPYEDCTAV